MSNFDLVLPWILTLATGLVLALSLVLFRRTMGQGKRKAVASSSVEDVDTILGRIETLRIKLASGGLDNSKPGSTSTSSQRTSQSAELKRRTEEATRLADQIGAFNELLTQWCDLMGNHPAVVQLQSHRKDLRALENETRKMELPLAAARNEWEPRAVDLMQALLPVTDRLPLENHHEEERLDQVIRKMTTIAGLELIEPKLGEEFDTRKHRMSSSVSGTNQRTHSRARETISRVEVRGLIAINRRSGDKPILFAEVQAKY